jgi:urease accessory protein
MKTGSLEMSARPSRAQPMPAESLGLLSALQLGSPALPIGGFAYSQGLEWAIEEGTVHDAHSAKTWIQDMLRFNLARQELVLWNAAYRAAARRDERALTQLNGRIYALKETAELRQESTQMGQSLAKLFSIWDPSGWLESIVLDRPWTHSAAHGALCALAEFTEAAGMTTFAWSWLENQVLTAVKHVPLGQTEGQKILRTLHPDIAEAVQSAQTTSLADMGTAAFGLAIASARHEAQYSRLFRS